MRTGTTVWTWVMLAALAFAVSGWAQLATQINALTGSQQTRIVWLEGSDAQWGGGTLKGFDTQTGTVTTIQAATYRQTRPILCTGGTRIVYTIDGSTYIVNWDGTGKRRLVTGWAADVWVEPSTSLEWVIVRVGSDDTTGEYRRYQIENTAAASVLLCTRGGGFPQTPWWQVSADGTQGAEFMPWPFFALMTNAALDLVSGADRVNPQISAGVQAEGCWSSMACDNSYWSFHFDKNAPGGNSHGRLFMFQNRTARTNVTINASASTPFYHPKFASGNTTIGGRFLTLTDHDGTGTAVEVYFGKFNTGYTGFDGWARVTTNSVGDYYPDCWVGVQSATPSIRLSPTSLAFSAQQGGANPVSQNVAVTTPTGTLTSVAAASNQTWLTTSVSGAGASWTVVNNVNINGLTAGTLTATVTVTASGVPSNTYTVTLTIGTPQPSSIQITPATASLAFSQQVDFTASVLDQQGAPLSPQPTVTWSLSGTGTATLSAAGSFSAGTTVATYRVIAASGGLRDTAVVTVYRAITITYPVGGEVWQVGQTVSIRWTAAASVVGVVIEISPDDGQNYYPVTLSHITPTSPDWGNYAWQVPATVGSGVSLVTNTVRIRIYNYAEKAIDDVSPLPFTVPVLKQAVARTARAAVRVDTRTGLRVSVGWDGDYRIEAFGLDGGRVASVRANRAAEHLLTTVDGVYLVKVSSADRTWVQRGVVVGR